MVTGEDGVPPIVSAPALATLSTPRASCFTAELTSRPKASPGLPRPFPRGSPGWEYRPSGPLVRSVMRKANLWMVLVVGPLLGGTVTGCGGDEKAVSSCQLA